MRTHSLGVLALAITLALAGCSSDSDSSDDPGTFDDTTPTVPGAEPVAPSNPMAGADDTDDADGTNGTDDVDDTDAMPGQGTPGGDALITSASYEDILRQAIAVANDTVLNGAADAATPLFDAVRGLVVRAATDGMAAGDGLVFVSREPGDGESLASYTFSCDGGGTLVARAIEDDIVSGGPFLQELQADDTCVVGGDGYTGRAVRRVLFVRGTDESTYDGFSVTRADGGSSALDGTYTDTAGEQRGPSIRYGWADAGHTSDDAGSTARIEGYDSERVSIDGYSPGNDEPLYTAVLPNGETDAVGEVSHDATAAVTFSVTAPWSSNERLDVAVDLTIVDRGYDFVPVGGGTSTTNPDIPLSDLGSPLVLTDIDTGEQLSVDNAPRPESTQWQTGTMTIVAADGSGLVLSPETGDAATFSITFDGETDAVTREWSDGFQVSCPQPIVCR